MIHSSYSYGQTNKSLILTDKQESDSVIYCTPIVPTYSQIGALIVDCELKKTNFGLLG